jgi:hypothetical protein
MTSERRAPASAPLQQNAIAWQSLTEWYCTPAAVCARPPSRLQAGVSQDTSSWVQHLLQPPPAPTHSPHTLRGARVQSQPCSHHLHTRGIQVLHQQSKRWPRVRQASRATRVRDMVVSGGSFFTFVVECSILWLRVRWSEQNTQWWPIRRNMPLRRGTRFAISTQADAACCGVCCNWRLWSCCGRKLCQYTAAHGI